MLAKVDIDYLESITDVLADMKSFEEIMLLVKGCPDPRRYLDEVQTMDRLQCSCGNTSFRNIVFPGDGVMRLSCLGCGQIIQISMSAVMASQAWERMEKEAPEPKAPEHLRVNCGPDCVICNTYIRLKREREAPEPAQPTGYKYPAML